MSTSFTKISETLKDLDAEGTPLVWETFLNEGPYGLHEINCPKAIDSTRRRASLNEVISMPYDDCFENLAFLEPGADLAEHAELISAALNAIYLLPHWDQISRFCDQTGAELFISVVDKIKALEDNSDYLGEKATSKMLKRALGYPSFKEICKTYWDQVSLISQDYLDFALERIFNDNILRHLSYPPVSTLLDELAELGTDTILRTHDEDLRTGSFFAATVINPMWLRTDDEITNFADSVVIAEIKKFNPVASPIACGPRLIMDLAAVFGAVSAKLHETAEVPRPLTLEEALTAETLMDGGLTLESAITSAFKLS